MQLGTRNRKMSATGMNAQSSRSHSLFFMFFEARQLVEGVLKSAKLCFVDLAGSEKISKTGATGQQLD
jgi:hypothetical protein